MCYDKHLLMLIWWWPGTGATGCCWGRSRCRRAPQSSKNNLVVCFNSYFGAVLFFWFVSFLLVTFYEYLVLLTSMLSFCLSFRLFEIFSETCSLLSCESG